VLKDGSNSHMKKLVALKKKKIYKLFSLCLQNVLIAVNKGNLNYINLKWGYNSDVHNYL
jgi:hypothetical protein